MTLSVIVMQLMGMRPLMTVEAAIAEAKLILAAEQEQPASRKTRKAH